MTIPGRLGPVGHECREALFVDVADVSVPILVVVVATLAIRVDPIVGLVGGVGVHRGWIGPRQLWMDVVETVPWQRHPRAPWTPAGGPSGSGVGMEVRDELREVRFEGWRVEPITVLVEVVVPRAILVDLVVGKIDESTGEDFGAGEL